MAFCGVAFSGLLASAYFKILKFESLVKLHVCSILLVESFQIDAV